MKCSIPQEINSEIAITLKSNYINGDCFKPKSNTKYFEQLEFFGDSALNYSVTKHAMQSKSNFDPHLLTEYRSNCTKNETLKKVFEMVGIQVFLESSQIDKSAPSKFYADVVEALLGELVISKNRNKKCKELFKKIVSLLMSIGEMEFQKKYQDCLYQPFVADNTSPISQPVNITVTQTVKPTLTFPLQQQQAFIKSKPTVAPIVQCNSSSSSSSSSNQQPSIKSKAISTPSVQQTPKQTQSSSPPKQLTSQPAIKPLILPGDYLPVPLTPNQIQHHIPSSTPTKVVEAKVVILNRNKPISSQIPTTPLQKQLEQIPIVQQHQQQVSYSKQKTDDQLLISPYSIDFM